MEPPPAPEASRHRFWGTYRVHSHVFSTTRKCVGKAKQTECIGKHQGNRRPPGPGVVRTNTSGFLDLFGNSSHLFRTTPTGNSRGPTLAHPGTPKDKQPTCKVHPDTKDVFWLIINYKGGNWLDRMSRWKRGPRQLAAPSFSRPPPLTPHGVVRVPGHHFHL